MRIRDVIRQLSRRLPRFPDRRINYRNSRIAPVVVIFVRYKDKILILKRSEKVRTYKGKWNVVAGYLDELKPIKEKVFEELREEVGISPKIINQVSIKRAYKFTDRKSGRTWIVVTVLVELKRKPKIKIDWEHTEYRWVKPEEALKFDTVPNFSISLKKAMGETYKNS
ncbi:MAG: NUDIX domain-containing protein [Candidatus Aenigmarchaeota archaeon]|nr:NUDIX domain-containing protein [Candidatus Aenigmarchaeota archaeon]